MSGPSFAESRLYSDLTRLFMSMKDASFAEIETKIEERFREFARSASTDPVGGLQITLTLSLPEGSDGWALYETSYRTLPAQAPVESKCVAAGSSAQIIAFPKRRLSA